MANATTTPAAPPAFIGWWRPNRRAAWAKLAEGASYDEALAQLLSALANVKGGDSLVTRAGTDLNRPARPYHAGGRRLL